MKWLIIPLIVFFATSAFALSADELTDWKVIADYGVSTVPPGFQVKTLGVRSPNLTDRPKVAIIQITKAGRRLVSYAYLKGDTLVFMGYNPTKSKFVKQPVLPMHKEIIKDALRKLQEKASGMPV